MDAIFARFLLSPILNYANSSWINDDHDFENIDFENASIIGKGGFRTGKTLETWNTKLTPNVE